MNLDPPRVTLSADHRIAIMGRGAWSTKVPASNLRAWRKFYAEMAEKRPAIYADWLPPIDKALRLLAGEDGK